MVDTIGCFLLYLYPHSHSKPEILPLLLKMRCHLWLAHLAFFLWIFHNVFASSNLIGTLRLADATYHTAYPLKDDQIAARRMLGMSRIFSPSVFVFYSHTIYSYLYILPKWNMVSYDINLTVPSEHEQQLYNCCNTSAFSNT